MSDKIGIISEWVLCPVCGNKTRLQIRENVILNMHMPSFKYIFSDERGIKEVAKENLLEVLSIGEKRAYYILNLDFAWNLTEIS